MTLEKEGICHVCRKTHNRDNLVDVGHGYYCKDCIGKKIESAEYLQKLSYPRRHDGTMEVNIIFFILIGLPIGLGLLGLPNFLLGFLAMVHEMGHFIVLLSDIILPGDNRFLVTLAGGFFECFVPFISFFLVYRHTRFFVVACLFLAAWGTAMIDTGRYMESAPNPYGYAFISGRPITYETHDYYIIFNRLGILEYSGEISGIFSSLGYLLEYVGLFTAIVGFFISDKEKSHTKMFLYGIMLSVVYTIILQQYHVTILLTIVGALLLYHIESNK